MEKDGVNSLSLSLFLSLSLSLSLIINFFLFRIEFNMILSFKSPSHYNLSNTGYTI